MSRIGKLQINLPKGVEVKMTNPQTVQIIGPHGTLSREIPNSINIMHEAGVIKFQPKVISRETRAMHGLIRTLVNNMVIGVTLKFTKILHLKGVGYRSQVKNNVLSLNLGYSNEIKLEVPKGIEIKIENNTIIKISGIEKDQVGLFASKIRSLRLPEPYNGKGVLYDGEILIRKAGTW